MYDNELIMVGLDFGTHQTKICVKRIPDEGSGEPIYEFFKFTDNEGCQQYVLPSVMRINTDYTLSYGYVDNSKRVLLQDQNNGSFECDICDDNSIDKLALSLYNKYSSIDNSYEDVDVLKEMLNRRKRFLSKQFEDKYLYRYFKQATFAERPWNKSIEPYYVSIWYLSYIIFLLDKQFGEMYALNMGVPTSYRDYEQKKCLAVRILITAYKLVRNVYKSNMEDFLAAGLGELMEKTQLADFSEDEKENYGISIYPEAYASLKSFTSRGKITLGMSLVADIGGGTTDISFFTVADGEPKIYRYWSIPRGLNYIAEHSGFDYADGDFVNKINNDIVNLYNRKKYEIINLLIKELESAIRKTIVPIANLHSALKNRVLVYTGGGSSYPFLSGSIGDFSDILFFDHSMWKEEHVIEKEEVANLCKILSTSYGLADCDEDSNVRLEDISDIFGNFPKPSESDGKVFVDKDMC